MQDFNDLTFFYNYTSLYIIKSQLSDHEQKIPGDSLLMLSMETSKHK